MSDKPRAAFLDFIKPYTDQSVVGIPRALVMLMRGDWTAAAMLNQILYWCGISTDPENWFYRTNDAWQTELCLTANQLKRYKTLLADFGVETKLKKANGVPTTHYRINEEKLQEAATPILARLQVGGIGAIAGYPQMARTGSNPPRRKPSNGNGAIAHDPPTEITSETNQQRLLNTGDRARANTPPQAEHVTGSGEMVADQLNTDPVMDTMVTPSIGTDRPPLSVDTDPAQTPRSEDPPKIPYGFVDWVCAGQNQILHLVKTGGGRPICGESCSNGYKAALASETGRNLCADCALIADMITALAKACVKDTTLHFGKLKDMALQLKGAGYLPAEVTRWRAEKWTQFWKWTDKHEEPLLGDVWEMIPQVRTLPANSATTNEFNPYLQDEYFARRGDDDDRSNPYAQPDDLPPRQLLPFDDEAMGAHWFMARAQVTGRMNRNNRVAFDSDVKAIGTIDANMIVIEVPTERMKDKFINDHQAFLTECFNRYDKRDGTTKPSIAFVVVVKGDDQYRDEPSDNARDAEGR